MAGNKQSDDPVDQEGHPHSDTVISPVVPQSFKMAESLGSANTQLPQAFRLKGGDNYKIWKPRLLVLTRSQSLHHHIITDKRFKKPKDLSDLDAFEKATAAE